MIANSWEEWEKLMDEFDAKWELVKPKRTAPYSQWNKMMLQWYKNKYSDKDMPKPPMND